jgi:hypothetical protein
MDLKKAYYYVICLAALFILAWGVVDLTSTASGLLMNRSSSAQLEQEVPSEKAGEPFLEIYYQKKMLYDRLWDSLARIVVAGAIFAYSRIKVSRLEK